MYLNLGREAALLGRCVIGVFDLDNASQTRDTRRFLAESERRGEVISEGDALPRSFVLTDEAVILTSITTGTLARRLK